MRRTLGRLLLLVVVLLVVATSPATAASPSPSPVSTAPTQSRRSGGTAIIGIVAVGVLLNVGALRLRRRNRERGL